METSVGVEIELMEVDPLSLESFMPSFCNYKVHDDRTVRFPNYWYNNTRTSVICKKDLHGDTILPPGVAIREAYGTEIVTLPYSMSKMRTILTELSFWLSEVPMVKDCSIHFHVDVANKPWRYVQNLLSWCYYLEAYLYRLSCGGDYHRGEQNDYKYIRPLSNPIRTREKLPIIDIDSLLSAKTASEMVAAWGRLDLFWHNGLYRVGHYVPHRLHGWNLHSVARQGTFEWRLWNGIYKHMPLMLDIVESVHNLAEISPADLDEPVILGKSANNRSMIENILELDVGPLWGERSPDEPLLDTYGHYRDFRSILFPRRDYPTALIYNRIGWDDGSDTYTLYVRSS